MRYIALVGFIYLAAYACSVAAKNSPRPPQAKGGWWKDRYGVDQFAPAPKPPKQ